MSRYAIAYNGGSSVKWEPPISTADGGANTIDTMNYSD